jgi:outer membrane protein OmpA-like peptidoglycan-associated protein
MHFKTMKVDRKKYHKENETYYYIDDVCLSAAKDDGTSSCLCAPADTLVAPEIVKNDSIISLPLKLNGENTAIVFTSVCFDTDQWDLKPESFSSLDSLANFLKEHEEYKIEINGYTDNSGDESKNLKLSENRAKAVVIYLIKHGIESDRISSAGYGSARPRAGNETAEGRAQNRRVEYVLTK